MFESSFKRIDDILRQEAGTSGATDYVEQTSWVLFLKYLDDLQKNKSIDAKLVGKKTSGVNKMALWKGWGLRKNIS